MTQQFRLLRSINTERAADATGMVRETRGENIKLNSPKENGTAVTQVGEGDNETMRPDCKPEK